MNREGGQRLKKIQEINILQGRLGNICSMGGVQCCKRFGEEKKEF
jgi:hypothetical protein